MLGPYMELDIDFLLEKFPASIRPSEHKQVPCTGNTQKLQTEPALDFTLLRNSDPAGGVCGAQARIGAQVHLQLLQQPGPR